MTDENPDPDWTLLPHDPEAFFGFEADFDLRELKRRYNTLIRRFKPEKSPAEFQMIRAAYEALELRFRSEFPNLSTNKSLIIRMHDMSDAEADGELELSGSIPHRTTRAKRPAALKTQIQRSSPRNLLAELKVKAHRTAEEQLLLTFLQDAWADENSTDFLDGLLTAVRTDGGPESFELLRRYLQTEEARSRCQELLERIFFVLASDDVFSLTQPLWDELQQQVPFPEFRRVLENCLRHVEDYRQAERLMFELRLLRRTMFYADPRWRKQLLDRLNRGDVGWPDWLDQELWGLEQLAQYALARRRFLNGNPLRLRLDDVIQAHCVDTPDFDQRFLDLQTEILENARTAAAAFPFGENELHQKVWTAWNFICNQVAHRFERYDSPSPNESLEALNRLPGKLIQASRPLLGSPRYWNALAWFLFTICLIALPSAFYFVTWFGGGPRQNQDAPYIMTTIGLVLGGGLYLAIALCDVPTEWGIMHWLYAMRMRRDIAAFIRRFPLPAQLLFSRLMSLDVGNSRAQHMLATVENDYALRFYAAAAWTIR